MNCDLFANWHIPRFQRVSARRNYELVEPQLTIDEGFQRVSARRNYELKDELNVSEKGFQRVSARRNYELLSRGNKNLSVSSVSLHVGIMN